MSQAAAGAELEVDDEPLSDLAEPESDFVELDSDFAELLSDLAAVEPEELPRLSVR